MCLFQQNTSVSDYSYVKHKLLHAFKGHHEAAEYLKINLDTPYVWDIVDPHTPTNVQLGLLSPRKRHLAESTWSHSAVNKLRQRKSSKTT